MTNLSPISVERSILEMMADPERPKQLLATIRAAEAAEQKAIAAKAEADAAMKAAADELTRAREVQDVNTKKSAALKEWEQRLAEAGASEDARIADAKQRLAEWEQRLKDQAAELDNRAETIRRRVAEHDGNIATFNNRLAAAEEIIARAERIKAASEA